MSMRIAMHEFETAPVRDIGSGGVAIVGTVFDDRGAAAHEFLRSSAFQLVEATYDPQSFEVIVDGTRRVADEANEMFDSYLSEPLVLEATTLGIPEIIFVCHAARERSVQQLRMLYVEPRRYANPRRDHVLHKRDFELSDEFPGFMPIPGHVFNLSDPRPTRGIFFLGFEDRRLDRALEDHQMIDPQQCGLVFGVPAFKPGWEMNSFARNIRVIRDKALRSELFYCGAENPAAAYAVLKKVRDSLSAQERMFIAPLGTKPNGIGAALFCAEHDNIGLLYDHPRRRTKRSEDVSRWHVFEAFFISP